MINHQNFQYNTVNPNQFREKWKKVPIDHELRILKKVYEDLQTRKIPKRETIIKKNEIYQKYTKLNKDVYKRKSESKSRTDVLSVKPKTSIESARNLGNLYSKNNSRCKKSSSIISTRPNTSPLTYSAFKLAQTVGNAYSKQNGSFISVRSRKSNVSERNLPKVSILQIAKEYGNAWAKRVNSGSDKSSKPSKKDLSGIAKTELRKDYGNYCSLRNRLRVLEDFAKDFQMNHNLRYEYERTLEKMSEFEMRYLDKNTRMVKQSQEPDRSVKEMKAVECEDNKVVKESEYELANVDYDPEIFPEKLDESVKGPVENVEQEKKFPTSKLLDCSLVVF